MFSCSLQVMRITEMAAWVSASAGINAFILQNLTLDDASRDQSVIVNAVSAETKGSPVSPEAPSEVSRALPEPDLIERAVIDVSKREVVVKIEFAANHRSIGKKRRFCPGELATVLWDVTIQCETGGISIPAKSL